MAQHVLPDPETTPTIPVWPDAGRAVGMGRSATYDAVRRGELPTVRVGRRVLVLVRPLRELLGLDRPA
jgi:hypothetical protein